MGKLEDYMTRLIVVVALGALIFLVFLLAVLSIGALGAKTDNVIKAGDEFSMSGNSAMYICVINENDANLVLECLELDGN